MQRGWLAAEGTAPVQGDKPCLVLLSQFEIQAWCRAGSPDPATTGLLHSRTGGISDPALQFRDWDPALVPDQSSVVRSRRVFVVSPNRTHAVAPSFRSNPGPRWSPHSVRAEPARSAGSTFNCVIPT